MTVTPLQGARCPSCTRRVANLPKHLPACERDQGLIARAGAHAADPELLPEEARFQGSVTDLDVARLLLALDRGAAVWPHERGWRTEQRTALMFGRLSATVRECLRLGLVHTMREQTGPSSFREFLVPAITHLRHRADHRAPACPAPRSIKRYRLVDDRVLVDCQTCLDQA